MKRFSIRPTLTLKGRTFKGLRGWSGKPLHTTHRRPDRCSWRSWSRSGRRSAGGALVFEYGFNVETAGDHHVWHKSETDVFPGRHLDDPDH